MYGKEQIVCEVTEENLALYDLYRSDLHKVLKDMPKEDRNSLLDGVKSYFQYGATRAEKLKEKNDVTFDEGDVLIKKARLYHGSWVSWIKKMRAANDCTLWNWVYLTSNFYDAYGYARKRSWSDRHIVIRCLTRKSGIYILNTRRQIVFNIMWLILRRTQKPPQIRLTTLQKWSNMSIWR